MNIFDELKKPFPPNEIHWRVGATTRDKSKGLALAYIDARNVMNRLDEVVGPENWQDRIEFGHNGEAICHLGIKVGDEWIWKSDASGQTDYEAEKGGSSTAFKRAGVKHGIGRYLYDLEGQWVPIKQQGKSYVIDEKHIPKLPAWALPDENKDNSKPKKADKQIIAAIGSFIKHDKKAAEVVKENLKTCGYSNWDGLKRYTQEQAEALLEEIKTAVHETAANEEFSLSSEAEKEIENMKLPDED